MRHWHTITLVFILASVGLLLANAGPITPMRVLGISAALALLGLVFIIARGLIGDIWALLPVVMLGFAPPFLAYGSDGLPGISAALALLTAIWTFAYFVQHPSRSGLIIAGFAFGGALLVHPMGFMTGAINVTLAFAALMTSIAVDWKDVAPEMRRHRFIIRAMRYARGTSVVLGIGIALAYLFYAAAPAMPTAEDTPLIIAWIGENAALRPFGAYLLHIVQYIQTLPALNAHIGTAFALTLPLPLLGLFVIALWSGISGMLRAAFEDIIAKEPMLINHIATNPVGFALQLSTATYLAVGLADPNSRGALMLILPPLTILAAGAIKRWFIIIDEELLRNSLLRVLVLAQNIGSISIKALVLAMLLLTAIITALISAPNFSAYTNVIGRVITNIAN
ncbi:MAG: hypothetical protein Q7R85_00515 [bacterium]|nr:hypothetical protein [bacterium]